MEKRPKKLLDPVREVTRLKHDSIRAEEACVNWIHYLEMTIRRCAVKLPAFRR